MSLPLILVVATRNPGKKVEIDALLKEFPITVKSLNDFGPIPPVEEDGDTFDANAYKKAHFTARVLGLPALADDSGLLVDALGGRPGVHSARFGGPGATDAQRCQRLLESLQGQSRRTAAFACVLSLAMPAGPALTYEARCEGRISTAPRGDNGFGYDPVFVYPPLGKTFAELTHAEKNRVSHRGLALAQLRDEFDKVLIWLGQQMPAAPRPMSPPG